MKLLTHLGEDAARSTIWLTASAQDAILCFCSLTLLELFDSQVLCTMQSHAVGDKDDVSVELRSRSMMTAWWHRGEPGKATVSK